MLSVSSNLGVQNFQVIVVKALILIETVCRIYDLLYPMTVISHATVSQIVLSFCMQFGYPYFMLLYP